jgi:hypothetical protein
MQAEYDGRQVVGIDLHRRRSVIVRMTEAGEPLDSVQILQRQGLLRSRPTSTWCCRGAVSVAEAGHRVLELVGHMGEGGGRLP